MCDKCTSTINDVDLAQSLYTNDGLRNKYNHFATYWEIYNYVIAVVEIIDISAPVIWRVYNYPSLLIAHVVRYGLYNNVTPRQAWLSA